MANIPIEALPLAAQVFDEDIIVMQTSEGGASKVKGSRFLRSSSVAAIAQLSSAASQANLIAKLNELISALQFGVPEGWTGPQPASFSLSAPANFAEGTGTTTQRAFTVTITGDRAITRSVDWALSGGSVNPVNAADLVGGFTSGTLLFTPSDPATKTIPFTPVADSNVEPDETIRCTISNATGAGSTIGTATAEATILNDDTNSVPAAINDLTIGETLNSLALTWSAPAAGSTPITNYIKRHKRASETSWTIYPTVASTATSLTITDMPPGDARQWSVLPVNSIGTGDISNVVLAAPLASETYLATYVNDNFIPRPASMPLNWGQGVYWPRIIDMRNFAPWAAIGQWAAFITTNHSPSGSAQSGVWLYIGRGSSARTAEWKSYDAALAAGWLDSLPTKPSANPIIYSGNTTQNAAGFEQLETFTPIIDGSVMKATMQASNITGYRYNQATFLLPSSSDGINWTLPSTRSVAWLQNPITGAAGNGHTGYADVQPNPYPTLINPATGQPWVYLVTSIGGGTDRGVHAWWGVDVLDPAVLPTLIKGIHRHLGIISDSPAAFNNRRTGTPVRGSVRRVNADLYSALANYATLGSGTDIILSAAGERFMGPNGRGYRGKSKLVLGIDAVTRPGGPEVQSIVFDEVNNEWVALYIYRDSNDRTVGGMISGPLRDPKYTVRDPTVPDMTSIAINPVSLTNQAPLPAGFSGSVRGTPVGISAPSSGNLGYVLGVTGGSSGNSEGSIFHDAGLIPADYDMIDIWFDDVFESHANLASRRLAFGFAGQKHVALGSITRGLFVANYGATGNGTAHGGTANGSTAWMHRLDSGTDAVTEATAYWGLGLDGTNAKFKRSLGVRLYPQLGRAYFLSYDCSEFALFGDLTGWDWSQRLYPFITSRTSLTSGSTNSFTIIPGLHHSSLLKAV